MLHWRQIKGRLNSGNACYPSGQSALSPGLLTENKKITEVSVQFCFSFRVYVNLCLWVKGKAKAEGVPEQGAEKGACG
jgi:hypothetical protein